MIMDGTAKNFDSMNKALKNVCENGNTQTATATTAAIATAAPVSVEAKRE